MNINQEGTTIRAVLAEFSFQEELHLVPCPVCSFALLASGIVPDKAGGHSGIN